MSVQPMPTNFTTLDLLAWHEEGSLELSPKFQRRGVWKPAAKGFFLDTLLSGYPVPPLHIRMTSQNGTTRLRREVIDGQQRLRTLFDFLEGRLKISSSLHSPWAGKTVADISPEDLERLRLTQFHVYQYQAISDELVLEIFARLNTYSVALTAQELRNGRYFGEFKSLVYSLARQHLSFWRDAHIFGEAAIARMAEAEFVSELLVLQFDGLQDKKRSLDVFYAGLDEDWTKSPKALPIRKGRELRPKVWLTKDEAEARFSETISQIVIIAGDLLPQSVFRRVPLLYSLYSVTYDALYGLPGRTADHQLRRISQRGGTDLRSAMEEFSAALAVDPKDQAVPRWQRDLAVASARQTDNIQPRVYRFETLHRLANFD